jgi:hypothetical protein
MDYDRFIRQLNYNDPVTYTQAEPDSRYREAEPRRIGIFTSRIVDFPDDPPYGQFTRLGVRDDGFNGHAPIYYVRLQDILFAVTQYRETIS